MYPINAASPERIAVGAVVQISDGAVQTSGVSISVRGQGGASGAGGGTTAYDNGIVQYTPTQAETNFTSFVVVAYKTGCIPVAVTVVTSASGTPGYAGTDQSKIANPTSTVNLSGTTIKTATDVEADTQDIQARLPAALVSGRIDAIVGAMAANVLTATAINADAITAAKVAADVTTEIQSGLATAANLATVAGYLDTEIAAILADTNELQTDWANGGRLDLILDARASQTSVDDLPTNAELATALGTADDATLAAIAALPTATQNADALLNRDMSAVTVTNARSPINALRWLRNRWSNSGGTLTVYAEDDTTTAWTATTTTAASDPVDSVDPT
jgi:hypothetical protein